MITLILDTETTGISKEDKVIELGYLEATTLLNELETLSEIGEDSYIDALNTDIVSERYFTSQPISQRAWEVHGIGMSSLYGCPKTETITIPEDTCYIIGHNISFDKRLLLQSNPELKDKLESVRYICTLALAKSISKFLNKDFENNQLNTLFTYYYPHLQEAFVTTLHNAKNDVIKTLLLLIAISKELPALETWEDIYNFQNAIKAKKK